MYIIVRPTADVKTFFNATFELISSFYSPDGSDRSNIFDVLPDFDASKFWVFFYFAIAFGLVLAVLITMIVCFKNFDPLS